MTHPFKAIDEMTGQNTKTPSIKKVVRDGDMIKITYANGSIISFSPSAFDNLKKSIPELKNIKI